MPVVRPPSEPAVTRRETERFEWDRDDAAGVRRYASDAAVALLAAAALASALLVVARGVLGLVVVTGLATAYAAWRGGEAEHAAVLAVVWGVLSAAVWTADLWVTAAAAAGTAVAYLWWDVSRGTGRLPR